MTGLGLYVQAKEFLAIAALEPRFAADTVALPALSTGGWRIWAGREPGGRKAPQARIQVTAACANVVEVARVKAGPVRWAATTPRT